MKIATCFSLTVLLCATLAGRAHGAIEAGIGLDLTGADITSTNTSVQWVVGSQVGNVITGELVVTGKAQSMDLDGQTSTPFEYWILHPTLLKIGGSFTIDIDVQIDLQNETISLLGGAVEISGRLRDRQGNITPGAMPGSVLLEGDVVGFGLSSTVGATSSTASFEFVFQPTGGTLHETEPYIFFPSISGTLVNFSNTGAVHPFELTSFLSNFTITPATGNDTGSMVVPEPGVLSIFLGMLGALLVPRLLSRRQGSRSA